MKPSPRTSLLALCVLLGIVAFLIATRKPAPNPVIPGTPDTPPEVSADAKHTDATPKRRRPGTVLPRIRQNASEMRTEDNVKFRKEFAERIKPAVDRWCKVYAGHLPFSPEQVTPDTFIECLFPDSPGQSFTFVIGGVTLSVTDDHGLAFVDYMMAAAAKQLFQLPSNPSSPSTPSLTRDEILRLLRADSGKDFPPDEIAIRPTALSTTMNGGVSVDVGKGVNAEAMPLPKYAMVFGPDGNLVSYGRSDDLQ
jgi:hypothetical protein